MIRLDDPRAKSRRDGATITAMASWRSEAGRSALPSACASCSRARVTVDPTQSCFVNRRIHGLDGRYWPDPVQHMKHLWLDGENR